MSYIQRRQFSGNMHDLAKKTRQHTESHGGTEDKNGQTPNAQCCKHKNPKARLLPFSVAGKNSCRCVNVKDSLRLSFREGDRELR